MLESDNNCCFQNWEDCTFYETVDNTFVPCVGDNITGPVLVPRGGDIPRGGGVSSRSYGRKAYIGDGCYDEMMDRPSYMSMLNQRLEKKSQFEKPYLDDEYAEMQHFYPFAPSLVPPQFADPVPQGWENTPWPGPGGGPGSPGGPGGPTSIDGPGAGGPGGAGGSGAAGGPDTGDPSDVDCFALMTCHRDNPTEIEPGTSDLICVKGICGKQIDWAILFPNPHYRLTNPIDNFDCEHCDPTACITLQIDADATPGEIVHVRARDVLQYNRASIEDDAAVRRIRRGYVEVICTVEVAECDCYKDDVFAYDTGNAATIAADSSIYITVLYGCPPFAWSVAGTDFSFGQANTDGRTNQLIAGSSACGSATITVTDRCGVTVTGYVRGTTGQWVEKSTGVCGVSGTGTATNTYSFELIEGNKLQQQSTESKASSGSNDCASVGTTGCTTNYCPEHGGSGCVTCSNCIDPDNAKFPCQDKGDPGDGYQCWCVQSLAYHEWECAP